ncbi:unnamed protein product [Spirodela intermedia]|uniref:Uncharacterized protein n=1 Tax=Spirodela intermedia TaxID=51605 RepID=A0A7I8L776_SPIIN|nr:unnamed protein product [Spirodela intermedia]
MMRDTVHNKEVAQELDLLVDETLRYTITLGDRSTIHGCGIYRLTKYAHFVSMRHPFSITNIVDIFVKEVIQLHGIPKTIIYDRSLPKTSW